MADSGSDDDYPTECPCGKENIPGDGFVMCKQCKAWQHNICVALPEEKQSFDEELEELQYFCERSRPQDHPRFAPGSTTGTPQQTALIAREMRSLSTTDDTNRARKHDCLVKEVMMIVQREDMEVSQWWTLLTSSIERRDRTAEWVPDMMESSASPAWKRVKTSMARSIQVVAEHATMADLEKLRTSLVLSWYRNSFELGNYEIPVSETMANEVNTVEEERQGIIVPEGTRSGGRWLNFMRTLWAMKDIVAGRGNAVMARIESDCTAEEASDVKMYFEL